MRSPVLTALLVLVLAVAPAAADGSVPAPGIDLASWEGRDAEARWVALSRSLDATDGASEEGWVAFLAGRGEWDLLEWVALTSRGTRALDALAEADAPAWVRVAVWALSAVDSHGLDGAREWIRRRPAVALSWLERFPGAVEGGVGPLRDELRRTAPAGADVSRYLPPLEPEAVLADLVPPPRLEDLGDRTRAELGRRYAHQVERAIAALVRSRRFFGEPWSSRLAALLGHPHAGVRRSAALAYGHRAPDDAASSRLSERVDDPEEEPAVRAAALLGLSYSPHPSAYATALRVSTDPSHPAWRAAVSRLGDLDDGFAPTLWRAIERTAAREDDLAFADAVAARLAERVGARDDAAWAARVLPALERAAWVDLACAPFESALVEWTTGALRERMSRAAVRGAVEALARSDPASAPDPAVAARVVEYAKGLLEGTDGAARTR